MLLDGFDLVVLRRIGADRCVLLVAHDAALAAAADRVVQIPATVDASAATGGSVAGTAVAP